MKISSISLKTIIEISGASLVDLSHSGIVVDDISSLRDATPSSLSFFTGLFAYQADLKSTKALCCFIKEEHLNKIPNGLIPLLVKDPYLSITKVVRNFFGDGEARPKAFLQNKPEGVSESAVISEDAKIGKNVIIMPHVYIGCDVEIEDGAIIHSNVSLEKCKIGKNSIIRSGVRVGSMGFGFVPNFQTGEHLLVPQISRVIIGDNVDIGANSCIDRGFLTDTIIGNNTKIDNLVHIAHGVAIGASCFIAGATAIAGGVIIGNFCMIGGNSSIAGNVILPDFTQVAGMSGVIKNPDSVGQKLWGLPAVDIVLWKKMHIYLLNKIKNHN